MNNSDSHTVELTVTVTVPNHYPETDNDILDIVTDALSEAEVMAYVRLSDNQLTKQL